MCHRWPAAKPGILEDAAGSRMFSTASTETLTSFTFAQCEPAVDREENRLSKAASKAASCTTWADSISTATSVEEGNAELVKKQTEKVEGREMVCGHQLQKPFFDERGKKKKITVTS